MRPFRFIGVFLKGTRLRRPALQPAEDELALGDFGAPVFSEPCNSLCREGHCDDVLQPLRDGFQFVFVGDPFVFYVRSLRFNVSAGS